jgi:hypothetical protein
MSPNREELTEDLLKARWKDMYYFVHRFMLTNKHGSKDFAEKVSAFYDELPELVRDKLWFSSEVFSHLIRGKTDLINFLDEKWEKTSRESRIMENYNRAREMVEDSDVVLKNGERVDAFTYFFKKPRPDDNSMLYPWVA